MDNKHNAPIGQNGAFLHLDVGNAAAYRDTQAVDRRLAAFP
jgi:hypothetical protein